MEGKWHDVVITIATDNILSAEVDLLQPWETILVYISPIDNASVSFQVADYDTTGNGVFADLYVVNPTDGTNEKVLSDLGLGNWYWIVPIGGARYIKIETSAIQTGDRTFRVKGIR